MQATRRTLLRCGAAAAVTAVAGSGSHTVLSDPPDRSGSVGRPDRTALQRVLNDVANNGASGVLAELCDRTWVWRGSAGVAELGTSRPVPVNGRFRIGSVTKTFVATVALQLVSERRLRLDDSLESWLPGVFPDGHRIAVRHLLQHTTGAFDYMERFHELYPTTTRLMRERSRIWAPSELLAMTDRQPLSFEPGTAYSYSNTNYVLLGLLIERVTERTHASEISRRILRPLGLRHTDVPGEDAALPPPHSHGYLPSDQTGDPVDVTSFNPSLAGAAGEMVSTAADLNRFYGALLGGHLLPPTLLSQMKTTYRGGGDYGMGLFPLRLPGIQALWGHTGEIFGYHTIAMGTEDGRRRLTVSVNPWGDGDLGGALQRLLVTSFADLPVT